MKACQLVLVLVSLFSLSGCAQVMALAMGSGILAAMAIPSYQRLQVDGRNSATIAHLKTVQLAIEQRNTDFGGLPTNQSWPAELRDYLPGKQLPASPWAPGFHQTNALTLADLPADGVLGPGKVPTSNTFDVRTYGALLFEFDAVARRYQCAAIGERDGQAVVLRRH